MVNRTGAPSADRVAATKSTESIVPNPNGPIPSDCRTSSAAVSSTTVVSTGASVTGGASVTTGASVLSGAVVSTGASVAGGASVSTGATVVGTESTSDVTADESVDPPQAASPSIATAAHATVRDMRIIGADYRSEAARNRQHVTMPSSPFRRSGSAPTAPSGRGRGSPSTPGRQTDWRAESTLCRDLPRTR